ncbi:hypothetical protein FRC07_006892 [Ceratobasidium sp. 392]|nr:hypothetical protein FRC07_006892 [Ceratobasidium sp. 392]
MRRRSLPKPDPEHVAKRKRFIAEQFISNGKHSTIKKTITWDDVNRGSSLHPPSSKKARLSESQTPGLSDKSYTPTPAARPLTSALKSATGSKASLANSQSRTNSQSKKEVVLLPPSKQPATPSASPPRLPAKSTPAPQRIQHPVTNQSHDNEAVPNSTATGRLATEDEGAPEGVPEKPESSADKRAKDAPEAPARPLFLPDSDDEREQLEEHPDENAWLTRHSPDPRPPSPVSSQGHDPARPLTPGPDDSLSAVGSPQGSQSAKDAAAHSVIAISSTPSHVVAATTSVAPTPSTPSPRPKGGRVPHQKRRRSSTGVQTLPEEELDWLEGMDLDASMSAVDVSRIWVHSSPVRGGAEVAENAEEIAQQEDEDMPASFLEEFEGGQPGAEDQPEQPIRAASVGPFSDADEGVVEDINPERVLANEHQPPVLEQTETVEDRSSPEPIPVQDRSQSPRSSPDPISIDHYAGMTEDIRQTEEEPASLQKASTSTATKTYGQDFTARVSALRASVSQPINPEAMPYPFKLRSEPDPKPVSASQPNRARSRMYTPQPLPGQALQAAPTLGRSMYGDTGVQAGASEKAAEKDTNALRAAPTLGRSIVWDAFGGNSDSGNAETAETSERTRTVDTIHNEQQRESSSSRAVPPSTPSPSPPPPSAPKASKMPSAVAKPSSKSGLHAESSKRPSEPKIFDPVSQPRPSPRFRATSPIQEREGSVHGDSVAAVCLATHMSSAEANFNDQGEAKDRYATPVRESESVRDASSHPGVKTPNQSVESHSNDIKTKSTDYDAEYGSILDVPSAASQPEPPEPTHISISSTTSSPGAWALKPSHSSTPQFQAALPRSGAPVLHIDSPPARRDKLRARREGLPTSPNRPVSLAALGKRRRSSAGPSQLETTPRPASKKIRREYDTVETGAFPKNARAHEDTYNQWGNRIWVPPNRPSMQRAPEGAGEKKIVRPVQKRIMSEDSEAEQEDAPKNEVTQENGATPGEAAEREGVAMENGVAPGEEEQTGVFVEQELSEVPETPQVGPVSRFSESILEPVAESSLPVAGPSRLPIEPSVPAVEPPAPVFAAPSPAVSALPSREQSRASPFISFSSKRPRSSRSKRKSELSGLQFTPAPRPSRTRLSLASRSGPVVEQVSERDAQILQKAGLKPTLKRLSQAHGFTTEVVADVYQEHGDLKETEEALKEMKRSAERARVKVSRRMSMRDSMMDVSRGQGQEAGSSDDDETQGDILTGLDATRIRREILFGN